MPAAGHLPALPMQELGSLTMTGSGIAGSFVDWRREGALGGCLEGSDPLDLLAGDRPAVDGVGSVDDPQHAGPGVEVGEGEVVADAGGAEYLDGPVDDGRRDGGGGDL